MRPAKSGGIAALLLLIAAAVAAAAPQSAPAGAPPPVLNIVRVRLKPTASGPYATLEAQIVRAYERAKIRLYWICLQSPRDASDVLYLNLYDGPGRAEQAAAYYQTAIKQHPEVAALTDRLRELTSTTSTMLTTRRDDVDHAAHGVDFATMRALRLTTFHVREGHEGDFLKAIRTTNPREGVWFVYEANDASIYALITLKRSAFNRRDGAPVPRALRRFRGFSAKPDTKFFSVRPSMSHVTEAFIATNPQFWRPAPAPAH